MIIAVDWDVKHQIKQVSSKFKLFYGCFEGTLLQVYVNNHGDSFLYVLMSLYVLMFLVCANVIVLIVSVCFCIACFAFLNTL